MVFDGVPIGISDGSPQNGDFPLGLAHASAGPGFEHPLGPVQKVLFPGNRNQLDAPASAALEGSRPARLPDGSWGSLYAGRNLKTLPLELVGLTITVQARSGKSWHATVTEVVERTADRLLVRAQRLGE